MKKNKKQYSILFKVGAIVCIFVIFGFSMVIFNSLNTEKTITNDSTSNSLDLIPPPLGNEETSFLEYEAGISAYTNVGGSIDLSSAKNIFRTLEAETSEYIIGSVQIPDYDEEEDVHCYVSEDGWIVAYYLNSDPTSKIVNWEYYSTNEQLINTKLSQGINEVCSNAGVLKGDIKYYDFRYPNANEMMIIAEAIWEGSTGEIDSFDITLPNDFIFYERSFSLYCSLTSSYSVSELKIDGDSIYSLKNTKNYYDSLQPSQLSQDVSHNIELIKRTNEYSAQVFLAIALVYKE